MIPFRWLDPNPFPAPQSRWLSALQQTLDRTLSSLNVPISEGQQISVTLVGSATQNLVGHGLGRSIRGWIPVGGNTAALGLYEGPDGYDRSRFIDLRTATAGSQPVNLWVY